MNPAQITGSTSSYARKYALNGLFLIDDTKDADATNTHGKEGSTEEKVSSVSTGRVASVAEKAAVSAPAAKRGGWGSRKATTTQNTTNTGDLY